jgi:hypothetical protein
MFINRSCPDLNLTLYDISLSWIFHHLIPPNRVRHLCVELDPDLIDENELSSWPVVFPNLSHFRINNTRKQCLRTISGDFLSLFPDLEDLTLYQVNLHFTEDFKLIKLRHIDWIVDGDTYLPECLFGDICSRAPHLNSFMFYGPFPSRWSRITSMPFGPLPQLGALEIDLVDIMTMAPLADPLVIPPLQHLTFRWIPLSSPRQVNRLYDIFLQYTSLVSLTRLTLVLDNYRGYSKLEDTKYLLDCLVHLIHLTRLDITGVRVAHYHENHPSVTYLCHLLSPCNSAPPFPYLQTIHIIGKIKIGVCLKTVIRMARARTAAAASSQICRLESIVFEDCEPLTVEQYRELQDALGQNNV